jgi:flagellar hook-length control protein FliK
MQSDFMIMNVQGDFGVSGSNFKRSVENSSSEFKDFLISADGKINQKISAKKASTTEADQPKFIIDYGEEKKSTDSEKLPEYKVKRSSMDGGSSSKRNSGTVQEEDQKLIDKIKFSNVSGLEGLIFNSNLLNQISTKVESSENSLTNEFVSEFSSTSFGSVQAQSATSTKTNNNLETSNIFNTADPELLKNLVEKIAEMLKNKDEVSLVQSGNNELEKILMFLQNQPGKNDLQIASSDITIQKFVEENISNIKSALEKIGIKVDELNIKDMNFKDLAKSVSQLSANQDSAISKVVSDSGESKNFSDYFSSTFKPMDKESFDLLKNGFQTGFDKLVNNNIQVSKTDSQLIAKQIDPQQIIDTVVKDVTQTLNNHKMELEVKLMPETLGKLTIKVTMEEGKLNANIEVKNIDVKQVIETNLVKMRDDLSQNGINLDKINVFLSDSNQFTEKQEKFFQQQKSNYNLNQDNFEVDEKIDMIRSMGYNTIEYIV